MCVCVHVTTDAAAIYEQNYCREGERERDSLTLMPVRLANSSSSGTELMREIPTPCSRIKENYMCLWIIRE